MDWLHAGTAWFSVNKQGGVKSSLRWSNITISRWNGQVSDSVLKKSKFNELRQSESHTQENAPLQSLFLWAMIEYLFKIKSILLI